MKSSTLSFLILSFCVLACSKVKKLDDMAAATDSLEKQTGEMAVNTGNTDTMYKQLRAKESAATRLDEFNNLINKDTLMETKITSAGIYIKAMEYQLATEDELLRDPHAMTSLKNDAVNDFIRKMGDLYSKIKLKDLDPTKDSKKHNEEAAFNAIATSMHLNHHHQEQIAEKNRMATVSMYDMIKNALRKDKLEMDARASGNRNPQVSYTSYEQILISGVRKEICIELIKARVDMLSAIALKFMTDKRDMEIGQFLRGLVFIVSGGRQGEINLPLTIQTANSATRQTVTDAIEGAMKAKRFLNNELKIEKKLNKTLKSAFEHIQIQAEGDRELEKINSQIEELLN
ncbi:MAG: hypothetical protein V4598_10500 [Bdellovibrionota bacterium]